MLMRSCCLRWICCISLLGFWSVGHAAKPALVYQQVSISVDGKSRQVKIPQGYRLEVLTEKLAKPRLISFGGDEMFIGSKSGYVYRLTPPYNAPEILVSLDRYPHSVALRKGEILIAQIDGVYHAPYLTGQERLASYSLKKLAPLPDSGGHSSRTIGIGPDGRVYASLGISGNCSDEYLDPSYSFGRRRGGVLVLKESSGGAAWEVFASGLRNPVGFDWHPQTKIMYASNNGPDHLGYEVPPEYFSRLTAGSFHGMPWFQFDGEKIFRDQCESDEPPRPLSDVVPPVATFPARNAPMGVAFIPDDTFGKAFTGDAIVALHGSWGTKPRGSYVGDPATRREPKLVVVRFENGTARNVEDLITGFQLADGDRWARPVGVAVGSDGALYFTSDAEAYALFRLSRIQ